MKFDPVPSSFLLYLKLQNNTFIPPLEHFERVRKSQQCVHDHGDDNDGSIIIMEGQNLL
jgi:hypothetical protein